MSESKYKNTISKIKTTEKFQNETIEKLKVALENEEIHNKKNVKYNYRSIGTIAASFICVVAIGISIPYFGGGLFNGSTDKASAPYIDESNLTSEYFANLPKLTVNDESGGMGFEGLCGYSIEDIANGNPWTPNNDIKTLPVYKNKSPVIIGETYKEPILTAEEMIEKANEIAKTMGIKVNETTVYPSEEKLKAAEQKTGEEQDSTIREVTVKGDGVAVSVETEGSILIKFEPGITLSDKYNFTYTKTNREEAEDVLDYFITEYEYLINMKDPKQKLSGSYNFNGEMHFVYNIYDGDGDLKNNIINYNFNNISFSPNDNGKLSLIGINKIDISDKVGDYPIITVDKATELLHSGNYFTSSPENFTEDKNIEKVELVYRTSSYDKVFMPYYKFWTELPSHKLDNGLNTYGAYYVPAVDEQYIENMPKIEFIFN